MHASRERKNGKNSKVAGCGPLFLFHAPPQQQELQWVWQG
jgi:hypothetical protein